MPEEAVAARRKLDGLAMLAFWLSFFLMVLPTEADVLFSFIRNRQFTFAVLFAVFCSACVLVPFVLSWRRRRRNPEMWRGRGYWIAAGVVLCLNGVLQLALGIQQWSK
ncbi:hypothetical protein SAMN05421753_11757 [Planctomicrobium piriforme]|uniref:Uncharacterized protein n=1 Tax=Planctomicrobium piriforme TaxID=1576369 RepID=A0A1I3PWB6_9PLAN|nr:hypothetical protein SAMN05421753_11757 [Planctomicrobium piriforme]